MTIQTLGQYNDGYHMGGSWGWGFMMMLGIVIAVVVIILVVKATQQQQDSSRNKSEDALETVKRRYASGEINKAEYDQLCKDLK